MTCWVESKPSVSQKKTGKPNFAKSWMKHNDSWLTKKSWKKCTSTGKKKQRRELERLKQYSDAETLSAVKTATQVRGSIKRKEKVILKDYEDLLVAHTIGQEKNKALQEQLERIRASYSEVSPRYDTDVLAARQQANNFQQELEMERKSHADRVKKDMHLIQNLRAKVGTLRQKMAEEIKVLQKTATDKEMLFQRELEELKTQLNVQTSLNLEFCTKFKAERKDNRPGKIASEEKGNHKPEDTNEDESCKKEESFCNAHPDPEPTKKAEVSVESLNVKTSVNHAELKAEREDDLPSLRKTPRSEEQQEDRPEKKPVENFEDKHKDEPCKQEGSITDGLPDLKPTEKTEVSEEILLEDLEKHPPPSGAEKNSEVEEEPAELSQPFLSQLLQFKFLLGFSPTNPSAGTFNKTGYSKLV